MDKVAGTVKWTSDEVVDAAAEVDGVDEFLDTASLYTFTELILQYL